MRLPIRSLLLSSAIAVVFAGAVLATPGSNLTPAFLSRGTVTDTVHYNTGEVKFQTKDAVDLVTQTITFGAPSTSGWHSHPGVVLVSVTSGTLVRYDAHCTATIYPAGSGFVESGDHPGLVRNESTTTAAVVHVTYVVPAGTSNAALRADHANPGCAQQ